MLKIRHEHLIFCQFLQSLSFDSLDVRKLNLMHQDFNFVFEKTLRSDSFKHSDQSKTLLKKHIKVLQK